MYYRLEQEPDCISIKRVETDREVGFAFYDDIPVKTRRSCRAASATPSDAAGHVRSGRCRLRR
jgi:hypothetical protein